MVGEVSKGVSTEDSLVHDSRWTPTPELADNVPTYFSDGLETNPKGSAGQIRSNFNRQISMPIIAPSPIKRSNQHGYIEDLKGVRERSWLQNRSERQLVRSGVGSNVCDAWPSAAIIDLSALPAGGGHSYTRSRITMHDSLLIGVRSVGSSNSSPKI
eukprot:gene28448-31593_t